MVHVKIERSSREPDDVAAASQAPSPPPSPHSVLVPNKAALKQTRQSTGYTVVDWRSLVEEDGRTYQGYMPGEYLLPNDGEEQDRLDFMHELANLILFGKLYAAPLESPKYVLDIGTGTGIWALEFAEQSPESHVIGTDLSLIQPPPRTSNCEFILENSETQDWVFPHNFDYVHLRAMAPCFNDLRTVIQKSWDNMNPGGWMEFLDGYWDPGCIDDTLEGTALQHFFRVVIGATQAQGRDMLKAARYRGYLEDAGFINITETRIPIPGSPWTQDKRSNEMAMYFGRLLMTTVDSYQKILLVAGLKQAEIDELLTQVKYELRDLSIHWYADAYVVYGQKPHDYDTPMKSIESADPQS